MTDKPAKPSTLFQPGNRANPAGRPKGSRDKVAGLFLNDLQALWSEQGDAVLRRAAFEKPMEFAAMVAKLLPAKLEITTPTQGMSLDDMERMIELAERMAGVTGVAPSMTIEGQAVLVKGGGGSPQDGLALGEVIEVVPSSPPRLEVLSDDQPLDLSATQTQPDAVSAESTNGDPDFSAAPQETLLAEMPEAPEKSDSPPLDEEDIDPASLF